MTDTRAAAAWLESQGATLVAPGYADYVAIRSDFTHLATVMGPALLGTVPLIGLLRDGYGRAPAAIAW